MSTGDIINARQAAMLAALQDAPGPMTLLQLQQAAGLGRIMGGRYALDLRERELVEVIKPFATSGDDADTPKRRSAWLYTLTHAGRRALARHERKLVDADKVLVPSPTFNTAGLLYVPPKQTYYRNEGNRHIASRGYAC